MQKKKMKENEENKYGALMKKKTHKKKMRKKIHLKKMNKSSKKNSETQQVEGNLFFQLIFMFIFLGNLLHFLDLL